jgi:hypothetical protein
MTVQRHYLLAGHNPVSLDLTTTAKLTFMEFYLVIHTTTNPPAITDTAEHNLNAVYAAISDMCNITFGKVLD